MDMNELNQKLNLYLNKFITELKNFPETFKNMPQDEQIASVSIALGFMLIVVALVLW